MWRNAACSVDAYLSYLYNIHIINDVDVSDLLS